MDMLDNALAEYAAEDVMKGNNPIVSFHNTYRMHEVLNSKGAFDGWMRIRRCAVNQLRYRVLHTSVRGSEPFMTQNTWSYGDLVPRMDDIINETNGSALAGKNRR